MRDLLTQLREWSDEGVPCALARLIDTEGSGPRDVGAAMAVNERGEVAGSVSGGCVESAVVTEALDVIATGLARCVEFGYSDEDAFAVGLTCGGTVRLFLERFEWSAPFDELQERLRSRRPVALVTVIDGDGVAATMAVTPDGPSVGSLGTDELDRVATRDARAELDAGSSATRHYGRHGETGRDDVTAFVESFAPPPRLLVFGAVDFTAALCRVGKVLGFEVIVCDAREVFATRQRFPLADEVVVDWPHRLLERLDPPPGPRDAVCVLTHDNKFDVPAIMSAFGTAVGYIGALGSRRTAEKRRAELVAAGATPEQLMRLNAPIGLDLGGRSPEETAISIGAEIIAQRNGRTASSLRNTGGPIHS
ncbi:MAG: XdhC/CoxI family protein [Acidimicrobiales bacterium]